MVLKNARFTAFFGRNGRIGGNAPDAPE